MLRENKLMSILMIGIIVTLMFGAFYVPAKAEAGSQRDLALGVIGGDVRQMQIDLNGKGYSISPGGVFGLKTQQAVLDFQKKNNLQATGVFDEKTRRVLKSNQQKRTQRPSGTVSRSFSRDEALMLARVVSGEARGESFEGQVAVAAVVMNRTESRDFPQTITGVVFQPGAFDAVEDGQIWLEPDKKSIEAAELALSGYDPTGNSLYYWNPAKTTNKWIWSRPIIKRIGDHVFAR